MKRAVPVLLLTVAGLVPLWRFEPHHDTATVAAGDQEVEGSLIPTRYGDVQVAVAFEGDRIVSVRMLRQPDSAPTERAVPVLVEETLTAQSADVDTVSGATATSEAYAESLQAAIDAKG
ncbi:FMN-binding protein [Saccharothrix syringae]|uniref:FMN-binding protein n=1 Tax=Saccharothrix syringae TaxID=103733 RepID=A0A5Q0GR29_SACSY|nr:FMN-binding protein [Saccharothrix syringae]QFZ16398.1 FMN-binding protein [Saccharothrix syringae]